MSDWVEMPDPLESGVKLPQYSIMLWKKPLIIADYKKGLSCRAVGKLHGVSHDTVARIVRFA